MTPESQLAESLDAAGVKLPMLFPNVKRLFVLGVFLSATAGAVSSVYALKPGERAPRIAGKSILKAAAIDSAKLRGKVIVVDFWASWCKPCEREIPVLSKLAKKHPKDVVVIGISVDNEKSDAKRFISRLGPGFASVHDGSHASAKAFSPSKMPSTFVIDKKGIVRFVHSGFAPGLDKQLEREVAILKAEK